MSKAVPAAYTLTFADFVSLAKPRITLMVVLTAAGGMFLAPVSLPLTTILVMLVTTAAVVSGANSLNCWLERDSDKLMRRTADRPLPAQRMDPKIAMRFGLALGAFSVPTLTLLVNPITGLLGAFALISYVAMYTPMKQRAPSALLVGAVPGALPPLMGWTAATGSIDAPGLALFAVLFFWQVPHFIAIATFRREEYERAGMKTLVSVRGELSAKLQSVVYTALLIGSSLLLYVFQLTGTFYAITALLLGFGFMVAVLMGFRDADDQTSPEGVTSEATRKWARRVFFYSIIYLPILMGVMLLDAR